MPQPPKSWVVPIVLLGIIAALAVRAIGAPPGSDRPHYRVGRAEIAPEAAGASWDPTPAVAHMVVTDRRLASSTPPPLATSSDEVAIHIDSSTLVYFRDKPIVDARRFFEDNSSTFAAGARVAYAIGASPTDPQHAYVAHEVAIDSPRAERAAGVRGILPFVPWAIGLIGMLALYVARGPVARLVLGDPPTTARLGSALALVTVAVGFYVIIWAVAAYGVHDTQTLEGLARAYVGKSWDAAWILDDDETTVRVSPSYGLSSSAVTFERAVDADHNLLVRVEFDRSKRVAATRMEWVLTPAAASRALQEEVQATTGLSEDLMREMEKDWRRNRRETLRTYGYDIGPFDPEDREKWLEEQQEEAERLSTSY